MISEKEAAVADALRELRDKLKELEQRMDKFEERFDKHAHRDIYRGGGVIE